MSVAYVDKTGEEIVSDDNFIIQYVQHSSHWSRCLLCEADVDGQHVEADVDGQHVVDEDQASQVVSRRGSNNSNSSFEIVDDILPDDDFEMIPNNLDVVVDSIERHISTLTLDECLQGMFDGKYKFDHLDQTQGILPQAMIIYRMVIIEGRCDQLTSSSLHTYIFIG